MHSPISVIFASFITLLLAHCLIMPAEAANTPFRHPVLAVSHGPGPLWLLQDESFGNDSEAARNVRTIFSRLYPTNDHLPKRILFITAHWESKDRSVFELSSSWSPSMIYDYYGFPEESYDIQYPAKGDPIFAAKVQQQLEENGIHAKLVDRGFDHGVFVPMLLIRPQADIPIVTMSINDKFDAKTHFAVGKAIAPFRDEDTLIICSGQATHNLFYGFEPDEPLEAWATGFQDWLDQAATSKSALSYEERQTEFENWRTVQTARKAHPSPDHFTPFVVAAGAGMDESVPHAAKLFGGWGGQLSFASYAWGIDTKTRDEL